MGSRSTARALFAGMLLVSSFASAAPSAAERETARRFMDEGNARLKANDPVHAVEAFQKVDELMHVPTTRVAVAKAQLAAGHLVEAREAAVDVARTSKEPGEPAVFEKARRQAREIEQQVKGRIPTVRIHVRGGTPTRVAVDDQEVPVALIAEPVPVNPGKRVITAKAADGSDARTELEMHEGDKSDIELTLGLPKNDAPKPAPVASSTSSTTPPPPAEKPKITGFGNDDASLGNRRTPMANGLIWGGFGVGAVGFVVGAVTGFMTLGKASDVKAQCENSICAPDAKTGLDSANTLATVSTIGFCIGIAGVGAGILGLVMPTTSARTKTGMSIHPELNGVGGTF